jgi:hypothetical protein
MEPSIQSPTAHSRLRNMGDGDWRGMVKYPNGLARCTLRGLLADLGALAARRALTDLCRTALEFVDQRTR